MKFIKYRTSFLNGLVGKNFASMDDFEEWWDMLPGSGLGRLSALIEDINS